MAAHDLFLALSHINTHWETGEVSPLIRRGDRVRRLYYPLRDKVRDLPFHLVVGPRQVGKTTMVGHIMQHLLDGGTPRDRIAYVPADLPRLQAETKGTLAPVLQVLERYVFRSALADLPSPAFLFIDEVHSLTDWAAEVKALFDLHQNSLRVLCTGSSSAALLNPEADLPGRVQRSDMYPLKFIEALEARDPQRFGRHGTSGIADAALEARDALCRLDGSPGSRDALRAALQALYLAALPHQDELRMAFDRYLLWGGYPAAISAKRDDEAVQFLEQTFDTALSKDLKLYPGVRKPRAFERFLAALARDHGGKFNASDHARELGLDKETPAKWKTIAEELFLVRQLAPVGPDLRPQPRKMDKAYIQDPGMRAYLSSEHDMADLERTGRIGAVVEGAVLDHLCRILFLAHDNSRRFEVGYLPRPEVDLVARFPRRHVAFEVKYSTRTHAAARRLGQVFGDKDVERIVVSRDHFDVDADPLVVPAYLLCAAA